MSLPPNHPIKLIVRLPSSHPNLLYGLDVWVNLGLISDIQVKQLCQENLSCRVVLQPATIPEPELIRDIVTHEPILTSSKSTEEPAKPRKPNLVTAIFQSLQAELSVRWLLFLGMFLVIVSSGVLAASQWERFPGFLQYGILLAYTLTFGGVSFWTGKQPNLRLTTGALLIVTLLLIPVNFWAMDTFGLWHNPVGWIVLAIATIILTYITILLGNNRLFITQTSNKKLSLINLLGLSYLHWGWGLPYFPLIAVYLAMIITTIATVWQNFNPQKQVSSQTTAHHWGLGINLPTMVITYGLGMVLVRAIFIVQVDITQLGLAIGICGWLMGWLAHQQKRVAHQQENREPSSHTLTSLWQFIGGMLLFLGWIMAVTTNPQQAIAVSGLAIWFFYRSLQTYSLKSDLAAIFIIGLQSLWLGWRLIPTNWQTWALTTATQLTNAENHPWTLLSVVLFPYVILMVAYTDRLYRNDREKLGLFGEQLTFTLGMILTAISLNNILLRSLNLIFSTITLAIVTKRRASTSMVLVYLTHTTGLLTVCSIVDWYLPQLTKELWAGTLLAIMVVEFLYSIGEQKAEGKAWSETEQGVQSPSEHPPAPPLPAPLPLREGVWRRSAWIFGLILASLSLMLLWGNANVLWYSINVSQSSWGLVWFIVPIMLTVVALRSQGLHRTVNGNLSVCALIPAQLLTIPITNVRLIGLLIGAVLMVVNTAYLRHNIYALITVGLGLGAVGMGLWKFLPGLAVGNWLAIGSVSTLSLWLCQKILKKQHQELATIYAIAVDRWAIALCAVELLLLSLHSVLVYQNTMQPGWMYIVATGITLAAIATRSTKTSHIASFYGIGWCLELLIAELLAFGDRSTIKIAIANIGLGLTAQLLGEWWQRKHHLQKLPPHWHILPLVYGVFGAALRLDTFANWTGLSSLALALITINIGRRSRKLKPLVYLGMAGVSIAAYELLLYQLSQASAGGAIGDGVIALAILGTSIMYGYRLLSPWLTKYFRLRSQELQICAHIHWVISSFFLIAATFLPFTAIPLALGTGAFLIRYAIFQGRTRQHKTPADMWVYLGLLEVGIFSIYLQNTPFAGLWKTILLPWQSAIAAVVSYFIFILPWQKWGWNRTPWRNAAYALPLIVLWLSWFAVYPITLIIVAGFYLFVAKATPTFRFSYISLGLVDWALWQWCLQFNLNNPLWYVTILGLSILYIAKVDPHLGLPTSKPQRHILRIIGTSLICGWAIVFNQGTPLIPAIISIIAIFTGLGLRVRAFLYTGTVAFLITVSYQSIVLGLQYSFLKWVIGLVAGIMLIYIAANFETQRDRLTLLIRSISDELTKWQ
ncbi:MAG: DUF2157 domain-containing protein [Calothrix sp. MO_167.B42]|nr:DUF2157 domain-containing protein [Calothrix sp. MO_167.B42]